MNEGKCKFCGTDHVETFKKIDAMHLALVGDPPMGIPGLVKRVKLAEDDITTIKNTRANGCHDCSNYSNRPPRRHSKLVKIAVTPVSLIGIWEGIKAAVQYFKMPHS